jgi:hypothetical protein
MCRIDERVYIRADGQRQTFEDSFPCHKSKQGKLCSNVKRKITEYYPKLKPIIRDSRDGTTSPASYDPPNSLASYDPPTNRRTPRFPLTIVHNPSQFTEPPTQTRAIPATPSSATFHINFAAPQDTTPRPNIGSDNLFPLDYSEFHDRSAPSSHAKTVITVGSSSTYYSAVSGTESKRHIQSNRLQQ